MNINIASTTGWLCEAGKDNRGGRVKRGFRTRTRLTKSLQNLLWDTIEPQSTHPMAPGRLAASLGRYLGARPKHVFLVGQRCRYLFMLPSLVTIGILYWLLLQTPLRRFFTGCPI